MSIRSVILAAAAVASLAVPGVASAQFQGHQYRDGYYGRYYGNDGPRWGERRRWEQRERRREWREARRHRGHHHRRGHYRY